MRFLPIFLVLIMVSTGCATTREMNRIQDDPTPSTNLSDGSSQVPTIVMPIEPEVLVYPAVPRHPSAVEHHSHTGNRSSFVIRGSLPTEILDWYSTELESRGWNIVYTNLPPNNVRYLTQKGRYLSISGYDISNGRDPVTLIRLQERTTPEITEKEARSIASEVHRPISVDEWASQYIQDFESEMYRGSIKHAVWEMEVKLSHGSVTVWVDAITGEPVQIRESGNY